MQSATASVCGSPPRPIKSQCRTQKKRETRDVQQSSVLAVGSPPSERTSKGAIARAIAGERALHRCIISHGLVREDAEAISSYTDCRTDDTGSGDKGPVIGSCAPPPDVTNPRRRRGKRPFTHQQRLRRVIRPFRKHMTPPANHIPVRLARHQLDKQRSAYVRRSLRAHTHLGGRETLHPCLMHPNRVLRRRNQRAHRIQYATHHAMDPFQSERAHTEHSGMLSRPNPFFQRTERPADNEKAPGAAVGTGAIAKVQRRSANAIAKVRVRGTGGRKEEREGGLRNGERDDQGMRVFVTKEGIEGIERKKC